MRCVLWAKCRWVFRLKWNTDIDVQANDDGALAKTWTLVAVTALGLNVGEFPSQQGAISQWLPRYPPCWRRPALCLVPQQFCRPWDGSLGCFGKVVIWLGVSAKTLVAFRWSLSRLKCGDGLRNGFRVIPLLCNFSLSDTSGYNSLLISGVRPCKFYRELFISRSGETKTNFTDVNRRKSM